MLRLTQKDLDLIEHSGFSKNILLSCGSFYIKGKSEPDLLYNELIGEKLAHIFGLNCPHYHFIKIHDYYYILSEDLNKDGIFKTVEDLKIAQDSCALKEAISFLSKKYSLKDEILDIVKIYIFDLLFLNSDRDTINWGILFQINGNKKITILDNECLFIPLLTNKLYYTTCFMPKDLESFLKTSEEDFLELFYSYYHLFTPLYLKHVIEEVEMENNIPISTKEHIIEIYEQNYLRIENIIKEVIESKRR